MAATAMRELDGGEEDIAAIAKQISDHAEAIYQTWKARGLGPAEILSCRPAPSIKLGDNLRGKSIVSHNGDAVNGIAKRVQNGTADIQETRLSQPPDLVPQQRPETPRRPAGLAVRLEVAREEERLMRALRTGAVLAERAADRPDVVPPLSLVDYAKSRYQDRLETPPTRRADRERRTSLGAQVTEARSKFEARARRAASAGATPTAAPPLAGDTPAPVRPFLTRGSVAERVLMFEKCPSEATLELAKRKTPAATTWRGPNEVFNKAQNYPGSKPTPTPRPVSLVSPTGAGGVAGARARVSPARIPRFHFPHGRPPPPHQAEHALHKLQSAFATFPNSQVPRDSFKHIVKACDCPLYWKMPMFLATQHNLQAPVDGHKFIDFWKKMTATCHDAASRFVYVVTRGAGAGGRGLAPEDLVPLVQDVVDTHPGLSFLKEATEFHSRYVHTVIARIFYCANRSWSGRISIAELRRSNLLQVIQLLEDEEDINQVTAYFSYEHFYVIYCKFWELDRDHDLFIDRHDLARHNDHALSSRMIDRVLSGCVSRGNQNRLTPDGEPRMSYTEFVWFLLAEEDKTHPTAIEYWFRCMDLDGDGILSMYELEYFYEEQMHRMEAIGIETLPFVDCLCQMLDMVKPATEGKIRLSDLKRCKLTPIFFDTFFNLEKYLDHEQRDPFATQRDGDCEMSEWDRFAAEEYELLVAEEGGSDAQDQISYDETDEDCLSPHPDEPGAEPEESSLEESSAGDAPRAAFVNLSSICSAGAGERRARAPTDRLPDKPATPEKPVNLTMVNGKTNLRYAGFGNNSFLYSQLLAPARDPPSYSAAVGELKARAGAVEPPLRIECRVTETPTPTPTPAASPLVPNGGHKISENYERAVAQRLSPQRETKLGTNLFGLLSAAHAAGAGAADSRRGARDEDEDYARDSDECSI